MDAHTIFTRDRLGIISIIIIITIIIVVVDVVIVIITKH